MLGFLATFWHNKFELVIVVLMLCTAVASGYRMFAYDEIDWLFVTGMSSGFAGALIFQAIQISRMSDEDYRKERADYLRGL